MTRFIFTCVAVVLLSVAAIPAFQMIAGISTERQNIMTYAAQTSPEPAEDVALDATNEPSADDLNRIESAAGGWEDEIGNKSSLTGGFRDVAPAAFSDPDSPSTDK